MEVDENNSYDQMFFMETVQEKRLVCLSKEQQKLVEFDLIKGEVGYACKLNLAKFMSPGGKSTLLVGFDKGNLEILLISFTNIFKLILK